MKKLTPVELWLQALRSGKYRHAVGSLQKKTATGREAFCCLGVACKVAEENGIFVSRDCNGEVEGLDMADQPAVFRWLGLSNDNGKFLDKEGSSDSLTSINDGASRNPFKRIAKIIESRPSGLFAS